MRDCLNATDKRGHTQAGSVTAAGEKTPRRAPGRKRWSRGGGASVRQSDLRKCEATAEGGRGQGEADLGSGR